ncbi:DUF3817 domain-containing protein [Pseudoclavibacter albus]|uniref:DUF3817 domain-containing protein n=1 Tax=Pseudoclavibacter albus TaxID=272241 RepID=UPI000824C3E2|nr:DUF3817 domain-containing protein [Pseudoclavibacter alba]
MTPKRVLRLASLAEAITWALLIIGMVLKYGPTQWPLGVSIAGSLHGAAFLTYLYVGLVTGINQRFGWVEYLLGGLSSVFPFATVPYDLVMERRGRLEGDWRTASVEFGARNDEGSTAHAPLERFLPLVRWSNYHPFTITSFVMLAAALILAGALDQH